MTYHRCQAVLAALSFVVATSFALTACSTDSARTATPQSSPSPSSTQTVSPSDLPSALPTDACAGSPVSGVLRGDSSRPDEVQIVGEDGTVHIGVLTGGSTFHFVYDPTLRVVDNAQDFTIAEEGDSVEAGGPRDANGAVQLCGRMLRLSGS